MPMPRALPRGMEVFHKPRILALFSLGKLAESMAVYKRPEVAMDNRRLAEAIILQRHFYQIIFLITK